MTNATPREVARAGLVHVIEGHRVFTQISVANNLLLAGYNLPRSERATTNGRTAAASQNVKRTAAYQEY
jgi:ABC-type branched-subunit amino acid transport system ATPase component